MIRGELACGCRFEVEDGASAPTCHKHKTDRVIHVDFNPPRFTGAVSGPHAVTRDIEPKRVALAPPLKLKDPNA